MGSLDVNEAVTGGLDHVLAVPPAVGGGRPEWRALADRDDDAVEGAVAGYEEDMELLVLPEDNGGRGEDGRREVEAEGREVVCEGEELEEMTRMGDAEKNGAGEGRVEEGGGEGVLRRLRRAIERGVGLDESLSGEDRDGLGGWEEGGEVGRDEDRGLHARRR